MSMSVNSKKKQKKCLEILNNRVCFVSLTKNIWSILNSETHVENKELIISQCFVSSINISRQENISVSDGFYVKYSNQFCVKSLKRRREEEERVHYLEFPESDVTMT